MKVAGTSIELALWQNCDKTVDIYTGSVLKSELNTEYDMSPTNNIKNSRVISRKQGIEYLSRHGQTSLLEEVSNNKNIQNIKIWDPICFEHTSPKMSSDILTKYKDYKTISVSRNPFDVIVSYFWWSFNVDESIYSSFNDAYDKKIKLLSKIKPRKEDSVDILRDKMEKFYELPALFNNSYRPGDKDKTVLEWISAWQNEFYLSNLDFYIRYESIDETYRSLLDQYNLEFVAMPHLKSKNRKASYHFSEYFSNGFRKQVSDLFKEACDRFSYEVP